MAHVPYPLCVDPELGRSNDEMAAAQCEGVIHIAVPGSWTCPNYTCVWEAGLAE